MRRLSLLALLIGLLAIGAAGTARGSTLAFTGTLRLHVANMQDVGGNPAYLTVAGAGSAVVNASGGGIHLLSFLLPGGAFGPSTVTLPGSSLTGTGLSSLRFTLSQNLSGSFSGISGGPPGGGPMGLSGIAKICLIFGGPGCVANIPFPLTPTGGGAGFGIAGTRTATGPVNLTLQDAPWTIGQPTMTFHTPVSSTTTPSLPGGFAHGPASLTSSTAQTSGAVQLVTVSKVYTSLTASWPETTLTGILTLHFVPEPGTLLLVGSGVAALALLGRRRGSR
jgi:hypothetical protein